MISSDVDIPAASQSIYGKPVGSMTEEGITEPERKSLTGSIQPKARKARTTKND